MGRKGCCYCGKPVVVQRMWGLVYVRAYCQDCLSRLRRTGCVDLPDFPSYEQATKLHRR